MFPHGIFRITAASPELSIANPAANAQASIAMIDASDADLVLLPELGLTGYTCGDLFGSDALLTGVLEALRSVAQHSQSHQKIVVVGLPLVVAGSLMNVAALVADGEVVGIVPKTFLPTYREFYEGRHFRGGSLSDPATVELFQLEVPFGTDLLFRCGEATIAIEICEDLWTPIPPSSAAAVAGANVLLNLSASNETIGKVAWRRDLVRSQSGRCIAAYAYASSGPGESTSDLVFGGHCLIAENGVILNESRRVGDGLEPVQIRETSVTSDIDLQRLAHDRRVIGSFDDVRDTIDKTFRVIEVYQQPAARPLRADLAAPQSTRIRLCLTSRPNWPRAAPRFSACKPPDWSSDCRGLLTRCRWRLGFPAVWTARLPCWSRCRRAMPPAVHVRRFMASRCPASVRPHIPRSSADQLIELTGVTGECIDIRELCLDTFRCAQPRTAGNRDRSTHDRLDRCRTSCWRSPAMPPI